MLWYILDRRVYMRDDVNSVRQLEAALHEEWASVPVEASNELINSLRKQVCAASQEHDGYRRR